MPDVKDVHVPDIGDFADVPVIEVMVNPGDTVAPEDPLVTLESDKATMEVPAPFGGVVQELKVKAGDTVSEGSLLLTLDVDGGNGAAPEAAAGVTEAAPEAGAAAAVETAVEAEREAAPAPAGATAGTDGERPAARRRRPSARRRRRRPPSRSRDPSTPGRACAASPASSASTCAQVAGSGRKGRILKEDVEAHVSAPQPAAEPAAAGPAPADGAGLGLLPWPKVDFAKYGEIERVPLSRVKKISGPNLHRNWVMIPHVTHYDEADITDLEAFRKQANEAHAKDGVKVTMVALVIAASVASLKAHPQFNASLDGDELVLKRYFNIGFAADTPQGLLVPVIRDAEKKGILDIARELTELSKKARDGKLAATDMQGGTFSISSLGGIGGTGFTPLINAPEVAILGVARSEIKPRWDGSAFQPR